MHPAHSVVLSAAASSAGYGLLVLLGTFSPSGVLPDERWFAALGFGLALGAVAVGQLASRSRPEPGGRAYAGWRTSWRARAAVLATATWAPALLFAFGWIALGRTEGAWRALGLATAFFAGLAVYATGMAHATRGPVQASHNRWVVPNELALPLLSGALWLNALVNLFGRPSPDVAMVVVIAVFLAFYLKRRYWRFIDTAAGPEMGDGIAPEPARRLRRRAFVGLFAAPLLLSLAAIDAAPAVAIAASLAAALSAGAGLLVERRLFFVETA